MGDIDQTHGLGIPARLIAYEIAWEGLTKLSLGIHAHLITYEIAREGLAKLMVWAYLLTS